MENVHRKTHAATTEAIELAARLLSKGKLVAFPTETVYGLGADAFNTEAIARVFAAKQRPRFDPLIVHISRIEDLDAVAKTCDLAWRLADAFWPGPLTLVLPKRGRVPDIVTAGLPTVAVRMPANSIAIRLIEAAGRAVAAPSANPFGRTSPTSASHVEESIGHVVDMIIDGGPCQIGLESSILSIIDADRPRLLRPGGVPIEDIQRVIGPVDEPEPSAAVITAPGMLPRHYAPLTAIRLLTDAPPPTVETDRRIGLLALTRPVEAQGYAAVEALSESGDLTEAAANLYAAMHRLDAAGLDLILCEPMPERGVGAAIMDRLRRATHTGNGRPAANAEWKTVSISIGRNHRNEKNHD